MISDLEALLARVEGATGGDWVLDRALADTLAPHEYVSEELREFTASLDAALALVERVLPGSRVMVERLHGGSGWAMLQVAPAAVRDMAEAATPELALLAALLEALIAQQPSLDPARTDVPSGKGEP